MIYVWFRRKRSCQGRVQPLTLQSPETCSWARALQEQLHGCPKQPSLPPCPHSQPISQGLRCFVPTGCPDGCDGKPWMSLIFASLSPSLFLTIMSVSVQGTATTSWCQQRFKVPKTKPFAFGCSGWVQNLGALRFLADSAIASNPHHAEVLLMLSFLTVWKILWDLQTEYHVALKWMWPPKGNAVSSGCIPWFQGEPLEFGSGSWIFH